MPGNTRGPWNADTREGPGLFTKATIQEHHARLYRAAHKYLPSEALREYHLQPCRPHHIHRNRREHVHAVDELTRALDPGHLPRNQNGQVVQAEEPA